MNHFPGPAKMVSTYGVAMALVALAGCDSTPTRPVVIREPVEVRVPVPVMPRPPAELAAPLQVDPRLRVVPASDPAAAVCLTDDGVRGLRRTIVECQARDADWRAAWGPGGGQ